MTLKTITTGIVQFSNEHSSFYALTVDSDNGIKVWLSYFIKKRTYKLKKTKISESLLTTSGDLILNFGSAILDVEPGVELRAHQDLMFGPDGSISVNIPGEIKDTILRV